MYICADFPVTPMERNVLICNRDLVFLFILRHHDCARWNMQHRILAPGRTAL